MNKTVPKALKIVTPEDISKSKGIIQFVHGMAEHKERYFDLLNFLSSNGYICAISDLRGHGENIESDDYLGYFGDDGANATVEDIHEITLYLKSEYPNLPFFLVGHSMGALFVRAYIKKYDYELDGLVISGSPSNAFGQGFGKIIINSEKKKYGELYRSKKIDNLINGGFSKAFKAEGDSYAWLSTDKNIWKSYSSDPYCGFIFTLNGFETLLNLLKIVYGKSVWKLKNPNLPIKFMSGEDDPCRINDKKFYQAVNAIKKAGYINVSSKLYPGMRHEIFNETDKKTVYNDLLNTITEFATLRTNPVK